MDKDCLTLYKVLPEKVRKICAIAASDLAGGSLIPDKVFPYIFSVDSAFGGYVVLLCDEKSGKAYVAVELSSGEYLLLGRIDAEIVSIKKEGGEETIYAAFRQKMLTYLYKTKRASRERMSRMSTVTTNTQTLNLPDPNTLRVVPRRLICLRSSCTFRKKSL